MDEGISWGVFIKGVNFEDVVVVIVTPALFGAEIVVKEWRLTPCKRKPRQSVKVKEF
jgi:hypothetical protein